MTHLGLSGDVRVSVLDDAAMSKLHKDFCDIEGTTDVLTFDLSDGRNSDIDRVLITIDTDIAVCLDEALRHATPGGYPVEHELLLYVVHGVLHCLGHDDHDPEQAAAMHRREDEILRAIGVGAVYARPGAARPATEHDAPSGRAGDIGGVKG